MSWFNTEMKEFTPFFLPAAVAVDLEKMPQKVLNSRCVLAVTERARGPSFIAIHRKWEGLRQVGGAHCWRRNRPHWRNCGRRRANARAHDTHMQPHIQSQDLGDRFICVSSSSSSLTCARNMLTPSHAVHCISWMDIHMKAWRKRGAASKTEPETEVQNERWESSKFEPTMAFNSSIKYIFILKCTVKKHVSLSTQSTSNK